MGLLGRTVRENPVFLNLVVDEIQYGINDDLDQGVGKRLAAQVEQGGQAADQAGGSQHDQNGDQQVAKPRALAVLHLEDQRAVQEIIEAGGEHAGDPGGHDGYRHQLHAEDVPDGVLPDQLGQGPVPQQGEQQQVHQRAYFHFIWFW